MSVRRPAVAGLFYPADAKGLRRSLRSAFAEAVQPLANTPFPKALVVPHAGYIYSGAVAAGAYQRLAPGRATVRRVVLLGPSHRVYFEGMAVPSDDRFDTPLGSVPVDLELRETVEGMPAVAMCDDPHRHEHSLEVQLPFLQTVLDDFSVLPISVGDTSTAEVSAVLNAVWGGVETVVVISTDLSHYHSYHEAIRLDRRTAAAIVRRSVDEIGDRDACGSRPLRGVLRVAEERNLSVSQVDLRNSGDTAGDPERVVGYGAFVIA